MVSMIMSKITMQITGALCEWPIMNAFVVLVMSLWLNGSSLISIESVLEFEWVIPKGFAGILGERNYEIAGGIELPIGAIHFIRSMVKNDCVTLMLGG